jgi:hypothetical protein
MESFSKSVVSPLSERAQGGFLLRRTLLRQWGVVSWWGGVIVAFTTHPSLFQRRRELLRLLFLSVIIAIFVLVLLGSHCALDYKKCWHSGLYEVIGIHSKRRTWLFSEEMRHFIFERAQQWQTLITLASLVTAMGTVATTMLTSSLLIAVVLLSSDGQCWRQLLLITTDFTGRWRQGRPSLLW